MMNNKISIVSLFASLMLLVPMTSVVGVSEVENNCGCQVVNRYDLFRVKLLMVRIKVVTNLLLLRFGNIPEVAEKCYEILDVINSNKQLDYPIICAILESIWNQLLYLRDIVKDLLSEYEDNPIIYDIIILFIGAPLLFIFTVVFAWAIEFECEIEWPY